MAALFIWRLFPRNISGQAAPVATKGDAFMFDPSKDWVTYIFMAFFIGFWVFIIVKGKKSRKTGSHNEGPEGDTKAPHED